MTERLLVWLVAGPTLLAVVAPLIQNGLERRRVPVHGLGHLVLLLSAIPTLVLPAGEIIVAIQGGTESIQFGVALTRPIALGVVLVAVLCAGISLAGDHLVRTSRHGVAFLGLLAVAQTAVNLVLLASDLLALYAGLGLLSLTLTLMIGLDFSRTSRDAALRVLATLEAPAAVALVSIWLIDAQTGTVSLQAAPARIQGLGPATALLLILPILIALVARAALAPLQHWVIVGARAGAAPVAVTIAGLALPAGGVAFARIVGVATLGDPGLLHALAAIAALSAGLAGLGALTESNTLGLLGYLAMAQVSLAAVGFATPNPLSQTAGWVILASGALGLTVLGLGLTAAIRAARATEISALGQARLSWLAAAALAFGSLELAPLPPFATFEGRTLLLGGLIGDGSAWGGLTALLVLGATLIGAAAALRIPLTLLRSPSLAGRASAPELTSPTPRKKRGDRLERPILAPRVLEAGERAEVAVGLGGLAGLGALIGVIPLTWLAPLVGPVATDLPSPFLAPVLVTLLGGGVLAAFRWAGKGPRGVSGQAWHSDLEQAIDPYRALGYLLLGLGRLSATILNRTLGRLAGAG